jgi:hypothetical protein
MVPAPVVMVDVNGVEVVAGNHTSAQSIPKLTITEDR